MRTPAGKDAYFGDQGLISVAFAGDIKYFAYPEIKNIWYMPYNFCAWFFDRKDDLWYKPIIIHYAGVKFKPWQARFSLDVLKKNISQTDFDNIYAPFYMKYKQAVLNEIWWSYCQTTPIYTETNNAASAYARALEDRFVPLCVEYNN